MIAVEHSDTVQMPIGDNYRDGVLMAQKSFWDVWAERKEMGFDDCAR